jgi:hypothetical protein
LGVSKKENLALATLIVVALTKAVAQNFCSFLAITDIYS